MAIQPGEKKILNHVKKPSVPPGKTTIALDRFKLLSEIYFNSITSAEIANTSGANEALIYMMRTSIGAIEYLICPSLIFDRKPDIDACTENLCQILLQGIFKNGTVK